MDAIGFAHFTRRPLNLAVTVTWDRCAYGDPAHGHILALPDRTRCARLRADLARLQRCAGVPFVATWARAIGGGYGPHVHMGLWWDRPVDDLVKLLTRLTGIGPTSERLGRGEEARADGGGWQIKHNADPFALRGALGWGDYLLKQEANHPLALIMDGKQLDVSRAIAPAAIAPHRDAFDAWKREVDWDQLVRDRIG